ncbi:MAG: hypothetical protein LBL41_03530 [Bifidobacteriaceae bacterium]|jgi:hypothetical protein|nr:hypothetical protein [Bifidobacteriaceae bacterium]
MKIKRAIIFNEDGTTRYEMRRAVGGGLSLGSIIALIISIIDNCVHNSHALTLLGQIFWVAVNTLCSWLYIFSYLISHALYLN